MTPPAITAAWPTTGSIEEVERLFDGPLEARAASDGMTRPLIHG